MMRDVVERKVEVKSENDKESQREDKIEDEAVQQAASEIKADERKLKEKAQRRILPKFDIIPALLTPGKYAIAYAKKAYRLVRILENRIVRKDDPKP